MDDGDGVGEAQLSGEVDSGERALPDRWKVRAADLGFAAAFAAAHAVDSALAEREFEAGDSAGELDGEGDGSDFGSVEEHVDLGPDRPGEIVVGEGDGDGRFRVVECLPGGFAQLGPLGPGAGENGDDVLLEEAEEVVGDLAAELRPVGGGHPAGEFLLIVARGGDEGVAVQAGGEFFASDRKQLAKGAAVDGGGERQRRGDR